MSRKTRRTEAQQAASRANGAKSHGPVTPEGKAISSQNALIHAFDATRLCTTHEETDDLDALINDYIADLKPANSTEADLVHQMAFAQFRLNRIQQLETTFFSFEMFETQSEMIERVPDPPCHFLQYAAFQSLMHKPLNAMRMIDRYESRYRRAYDRALAALRNLQKDRQQAELHELRMERERRRFAKEKPSIEKAAAQEPSPKAKEFSRNEPDNTNQLQKNTPANHQTVIRQTDPTTTSPSIGSVDEEAA